MICTVFYRLCVKLRAESPEGEFEYVEMALAIAYPLTSLITTVLMFYSYLGSRWFVVCKRDG